MMVMVDRLRAPLRTADGEPDEAKSLNGPPGGPRQTRDALLSQELTEVNDALKLTLRELPGPTLTPSTLSCRR